MLKSNVLFANRVPLAPFLRLLGVENSQPILLSLAQGCLKALSEQKMTLVEAENLIFNPEILQLCQEQGVTEALMEVIESGMEFTDIAELVTDKHALSKAISDCLDLLQGIPGRRPSYQALVN